MRKIILSFLLILGTVSAKSATLHCVSNESDIAAINPLDTDALGFWSLEIPKKFEIDTEGGNVTSVKYKFADQVREDDIPDTLTLKTLAFKDEYVDLGKKDELYKGFYSRVARENSREASIKIHSKFQKWGMDSGVNKLWTLTLDKSNLTGKIEAKKKVTFFEHVKLETRFNCK